MAPASATTRRIFGLAAVALALAATNNAGATTSDYVVDTTGGVTDMGPPSGSEYYGEASDGCEDGTVPVVDSASPAPTANVRCITIDTDYQYHSTLSDTLAPTAAGTEAGGVAEDAAAPTAASITPPPTLSEDETVETPAPTVTSSSAATSGNADREVTATDDETPAPSPSSSDGGADAVAATAGPTNEDGDTGAGAEGEADGAPGLGHSRSPAAAVLSAAAAALLAAAVLAA